MDTIKSSNMHSEEEVHEAHVLERFLYSTCGQGDQNAWGELEHDLREIVRNWLHAHPRREVACHYASKEHYVALAVERFRQATVQGQATCKTRAEALVLLRASLNGVILETLHIALCPQAASMPVPGEPDGQYAADDSAEVWKRLQSLLPAEREQRLVYLLYHCGLSPQEIVRLCPLEWSDVQEILRLRRMILERLLHHENSRAL